MHNEQKEKSFFTTQRKSHSQTAMNNLIAKLKLCATKLFLYNRKIKNFHVERSGQTRNQSVKSTCVLNFVHVKTYRWTFIKAQILKMLVWKFYIFTYLSKKGFIQWMVSDVRTMHF